EAAIEIADADRVDLAVVAFDAGDGVLGQFDRGYLFRCQRRRQLNGGPKAPLRFGHGVLLFPVRGKCSPSCSCGPRCLLDRNCGFYAAPIRIPPPSTMAPPSTIWNTACRNGVSM